MKPSFGSIAMMITVLILYNTLYKSTGINSISCLVSIGIGAIIYAASILVLKVFNINEIKNRFRKV